MQPKLCTKCKKNVAVVFITKIENGVTMNEGFCLKCARSLGIPQIDQAVKQMGLSEEELEDLANEMNGMTELMEQGDQDEDEIGRQTATFPLLNQMFGSSDNLPQPADKKDDANSGKDPRDKQKKKEKT